MVVNYADARAVVEAIALVTGSYSCPLLSGSVKKIADETLFLELTRRGYNLSSVLRENTGKTAKFRIRLTLC